jgi:hypothetical protein
MMKFALVVTLALASSAAFAQNTVTALSGSTNVTLSTSFLSALQSLDVTAGVVYPTILNGAVVNFPIASGAIDLDTAKGNLDHQGGLTLTAGSTTVAIQDFLINTTKAAPVITGLVIANGALSNRITLFDLAFGSGFSLPLKETDNTLLHIGGVTVTLDAAAASTLNTTFGVTAFKAGMSVGTATVNAVTVAGAE